MHAVLGICRAAVAIGRKYTCVCLWRKSWCANIAKPEVFLLVLGMPFSHSCSSLAGEISVLGAGVTLDVIHVPARLASPREHGQRETGSKITQLDQGWMQCGEGG